MTSATLLLEEGQIIPLMTTTRNLRVPVRLKVVRTTAVVSFPRIAKPRSNR